MHIFIVDTYIGKFQNSTTVYYSVTVGRGGVDGEEREGWMRVHGLFLSIEGGAKHSQSGYRQWRARGHKKV